MIACSHPGCCKVTPQLTHKLTQVCQVWCNSCLDAHVGDGTYLKVITAHKYTASAFLTCYTAQATAQAAWACPRHTCIDCNEVFNLCLIFHHCELSHWCVFQAACSFCGQCPEGYCLRHMPMGWHADARNRCDQCTTEGSHMQVSLHTHTLCCRCAPNFHATSCSTTTTSRPHARR